MTRFLRVVALLGLCCSRLKAQEVARPPGTIHLQSTDRRTHLYARMRIANTSAHGIIVPVCDDDEKKDLLCSPVAARLEVRRRETWSSPETTCGCALGGLPLADGRWLEAGESADFIFDLMVDLYKLRKGQSVRLRLDVYPNEAAMKNMRGSSPLFSEPFRLP